MGYITALQEAGATVLAEGTFGSYQGNWYAKVEYQGETLLVGGYYGSCSHCDAFQAEFGYFDEESESYQVRLAEFGHGYLTDPLIVEKEISDAKRDADWDGDSREMLRWLEEHFPQD